MFLFLPINVAPLVHSSLIFLFSLFAIATNFLRWNTYFEVQDQKFKKMDEDRELTEKTEEQKFMSTDKTNMKPYQNTDLPMNTRASK